MGLPVQDAADTLTRQRPAGLAGADREDLLRDVMDRIGDKWSVRVICRLDAGPLRFNALRREVGGITQRMLSATVRRLERDGLVSRTVRPTAPPSVEYELTERGRSLHGILASLVAWTEENVDDIQRCRDAYDSASACPGPSSPAAADQ